MTRYAILNGLRPALQSYVTQTNLYLNLYVLSGTILHNLVTTYFRRNYAAFSEMLTLD